MDFVYYNPIYHSIQKQSTQNFIVQRIVKKSNKHPLHGSESLYDIYSSRFHREILSKKRRVPTEIHTEMFQIKKSLRRHSIFMETEYLEERYEEINLYLSSNKTATIEALQPKKVDIKKESYDELSMSYPKPRMPIFSFCRELLPSSEPEPESDSEPFIPEKMMIVFPPEYPKEPFYLYMDDVLYIKRIHCCHLERVKKTVGKYIKTYRPFLGCVSCGCILHKTNWKPNIHLSDVLNEHQFIQQLKENVKYDILLGELIQFKQLDYSIMVWILEFLYIVPIAST